jgi:deazaflavin-dependent oxidoreductase (nitroreductase family)
VGSEIAHLVRREPPVHHEVVPHVGCDVPFRERAARFLRRLYATASAHCDSALLPSGSVAGRSARSVGEHTLREGSGGYLEASDVAIRVSPPGTRGARVPTPLVKFIGKRQMRTYRRSGEQRVSSRAGFPVVLLNTRGAKTGRTRTTPVGGFPDGENSWLVAATLGGAARHPSWFLNMAKHPDDIWLEVGTERFKVRGESLEGQERAESLARIAKIAPRYGKYQEKTDREIPIVRLTREP